MTTNNVDLSGLAQQALSGGQVPAGLPDADELTRLANQFFSELPGGSQPIDALPPSASYHSVPQGFDRRPGVDDRALSGVLQPRFGSTGEVGPVSEPRAPSAASFGNHYADAIDNVPHSAASSAAASTVPAGLDRLPGIDENALAALASRS
ncbi:MAG: family 2A encapsulin nanocompartment cargo protein cysteine desulfurase, partial [Methylomonas sp.]